MSQPLPSEPNFRSLSREEGCQLLGSLDRTVTTIPSSSCPGLLNRRPSLCPSFHDVDVEDLGVGLAHVGSYSSGIILDLGALSYPSIDPRPKTIQKQAPSVEATQYGTFEEEATHVDESVCQEEGYEGSKYIGIAPIRFWLVFSVILLSYFIACFDSTLMASSHPVITSHFGAAQAASWLSTVFLITSTAFQPLSGRLSDTVGRKPVLLLSLAIFGTTTLGCALAGRIEVFITARALCGVGAGGTMSMCLIIVSDLVRLEYRGVFQSHINVAFGLGSASGAAFGGWLCDTIGWRWAFGIQVPFIFICFLMAAFLTPSNLGPMLMISEEDGGSWSALRSFDSMGSLCFTITITSLILALNLGGNIVPWSSPVIITCFGIFLVMGFILVRVEMKAEQPLIPLHLLTRPPIANMVFANLLGGVASNTVLFNLPLFFQAVLFSSASRSGFQLALPNLMGSLAGVSTGYIITYTRRLKPTLVIGALIYLFGSIAVSLINKHTSEVISLLLITGVPIGQGFVFPNTMMSALAVSDQASQAVVTTTVGLWRNLGVVFGIVLSSLVFQNRLITELEARVTGPESDQVIRTVRASIEAIRFLPDPVQDQVVEAYASSLRSTFLCAVVASVLLVILILPVQLPQLRQGRQITAGVAE